ncbi:helix-turn-helix transcriptional regulator [Morganella morganii subsp. morganii]|uniref:helix-turn-helix domain-containing protein n=1 Tax=Morganella morganii TaxID=582 RepID=UPI001BAD1922|nr:helix-turn-helix transcriptional regulator [Morganella morganii subsp. morganii]QUI29307.1 helix-turn-helix transcriptional regulator [Morganella morganii]
MLWRQESIYSCVGTRIKEKRKYLGLSIVRLAEDMGITQQQFNRYERGTSRISIHYLAEMFHVPVDYFFDQE